MAEGQENLTPTSYVIKIKGHLDIRWTEWLYDLTIIHESDGTTTLSGPLPDQTILHSVLTKIRDMNLPLISVTPIEPDPQDSVQNDSKENEK